MNLMGPGFPLTRRQTACTTETVETNPMKNIINYIFFIAFLLLTSSVSFGGDLPRMENPLTGLLSQEQIPLGGLEASTIAYVKGRKVRDWTFPRTGDPEYGTVIPEGAKPSVEGGDIYQGTFLGKPAAFQYGMPQVFWIRAEENGLSPQEAAREWAKLTDDDRAWALADATRWWQMQKADATCRIHAAIVDDEIKIAEAKISSLEARLKEIEETPSPGWYQFWKDSKPSGVGEAYELQLWKDKLRELSSLKATIARDMELLRKKK